VVVVVAPLVVGDCRGEWWAEGMGTPMI
jgi:hypothetical protein